MLKTGALFPALWGRVQANGLSWATEQGQWDEMALSGDEIH